MPHDYKEIIAESEFLQLHRKHERRPQHLKEIIDYGESLRREMGDEAKMRKRAKEVKNIIKDFVTKMKESQNDTAHRSKN